MGYNFHERGVPKINYDTCTGCGDCVNICPDGVLQLENGKARAVAGVFMGCIACGHCMAVCPTGSIGVSGRGMMPEDRIPLPAVEATTAEQMEALLTARRSVRKFTRREVAPELVDQIVRMAATAPMGIPPSDVGLVVFSRREQVRAFAEDACACFEKMGRFFSPFKLAIMRPFIGKYRYEMFRDFIRPLMMLLPESKKQGRDVFTFDAPAALLFHYGPMGDASDCMINATYAMLAAESLKLGSCMLGTTVALTHDKRFKAMYGIPQENKVGIALVLGYPDVKFRYGIRRRFAWLKQADGK